MVQHIPDILLWLFVINHGIAFGAGLYEQRVERIATFSYFIPTAVRLMRAETLPSAKVEAMASRWMRLNHVRAALALTGWLAALRALSLPGA